LLLHVSNSQSNTKLTSDLFADDHATSESARRAMRAEFAGMSGT
jgi:hypothetical protein